MHHHVAWWLLELVVLVIISHWTILVISVVYSLVLNLQSLTTYLETIHRLNGRVGTFKTVIRDEAYEEQTS